MGKTGPVSGQQAGRTSATPALTAPWGYGPNDGPGCWGTLDPAFSVCALGKAQSPIDLTGGQWADLTPIKFDYGRTRIVVENTGHTIQMTPEPGNGIVVDGMYHELLQFHFHHRSEHLFDGTRFPLELHLVHGNGEGGLAVIGILVAQGEANGALAPSWAHLPAESGTPHAVAEELDLASLLPSFGTTWRYMGSLTTPPCTEGVAWIIPFKTLSMSAGQIDAFAAIHPNNCRPVQPLGERVLYRG